MQESRATHMNLAYPLILFLSPLLAQPKLLPYSHREREREREMAVIESNPSIWEEIERSER